MAPEQSKPAGRLNAYLPLIFGLIIGSTIAATTDQWWWATVGAVAGALVGWISGVISRRRH